MRCHCCDAEIVLARKVKIRRHIEWDPSTPVVSDWTAADWAASQLYTQETTYRWAVICQACYQLLDNHIGAARIGEQTFNIAGASRHGKATTVDEAKYQAGLEREARRTPSGSRWLAADTPETLLRLLRERDTSDRKLRLFACACCRRLWHALSESEQAGIVLAERLTDEGATADEFLAARQRLQQTTDLEPASVAVFHLLDPVPGISVEFAACQAALAASLATPGVQAQLRTAEAGIQANLLRHIVGNPWRPAASPGVRPSVVVRLAEALYGGADVRNALHDALLDADQPELAAHFRSEEWHPKGCWAIDLILGKK
jgi:hypothetical protein